MEATPLQTTFYKEQKQQMKIRIVGHNMKYEAECITMLFFPDEKIVTTEYPADTEFPEQDEEDFIEARQQRGLMKVTLHLNGRETSLCRTVLSNPRTPYEEAEYIMSDMMFTLLCEATGTHPAWGMLTGVRPIKLFHKRLDAGMSREMVAREFAQRFYVTEEKIDLALQTAHNEAPILKEATDDTYSLYISIPFCPSRCSYCSFVSHDITSKRAKDILPVYVDRLCEELCCIAQKMAGTGLALTTVYFGGGTPTILSAGQLDQICTAVEKNFDLSRLKEYTVEAGRPDTIDRETLRTLRRHRVTRISINPQTLNDEVLAGIGRKHTAQQIIDCFEMAREEGFDDINMDVIAALPGEDYAMFAHTLAEIRRLRPESLTVHTLAIKRSSRLHEEKYAQAEQDVARMVALGRQTAHDMGMRAYYLYRQKYMAENLENVGYALPGRFCRYNIDNMEETTSILALGAGGISKCVMREEEKILRAPNIANIEQYIDRVDEMIERKRIVFAEKAKKLD